MQAHISLHHPRVLETNTSARLSSILEFDGKSIEMWYELPKQYGHWFSTDRSDGFVVGFILQAMELHKDIHLQAPMSLKLWHNLTHFFIPMMAKAFPNLQPIKITPFSLIETTTQATGVAGGFSGGIDSFAAIVDHFVNATSDSYRISDFLFHNVGSHGDKKYEAARVLFHQRYEELKQYPDLVNVPYVPVDTNIHEVVPTEFVKTYITLNASVPLVLQNHFRRYFYASSYKYEDCGVNNTDIVGRFDPIAFHLLSTETLDCVSTGGQMSRVEKTQLVAGYDLSQRFLNVCATADADGRNCSACIKCCRTLLTLELLNKEHLYTDVFDLEHYKSIRWKYIKNSVLKSRPGSFEYEIAELAIEVGKEAWTNTLRARVARRAALANIKGLYTPIRTTLGKIARKIGLR
jgi:hypothetical protein